MHQHDTRNGTWLMKRVHYLAEIAIALQGQSGLAQNISWSHHMGEPLRPSLLLTPVIEGRASKWRVQLLPVPPEDFFAVHAFSPQKKNIKHEGSEKYQTNIRQISNTKVVKNIKQSNKYQTNIKHEGSEKYQTIKQISEKYQTRS